jgi:hypothetical protein
MILVALLFLAIHSFVFGFITGRSFGRWEYEQDQKSKEPAK